MNDVKKLRKKHPCPTNNAICKMLEHHMSATHGVIQQAETHLAEDEKKIENLSLMLSAAKEKLNVEKRALHDKKKELDAENEKLSELKAEKNRIVKNNFTLEKKCLKLRTARPNTYDQHILDLGQKKYNLYKELTRIRWDYPALEQSTRGFVTDKKKYIHLFSFPNAMESREMSDLLWREIQLSTEKKFDDNDEEKENNSSNA